MVGVLIATHGRLAEELIRTAESVVGPLPRVRPMGVVSSDPGCRDSLDRAIRDVDDGDGVLLLTDLLGGSPTNLCLSFLLERRVEVVTGVNLPMLLKLPSVRASGKPIADMARDLTSAGQKSIVDASDLVRGRLS